MCGPNTLPLTIMADHGLVGFRRRPGFEDRLGWPGLETKAMTGGKKVTRARRRRKPRGGTR
jgi:hypothetical protein